MAAVRADELSDLVGRHLGYSEWMTIDQSRIDDFADVTLDHQYIHVDPERAAATPFGSTIAHGFLSLSLVTHLLSGVMPEVEGTVMGVNYGLDRLRFLTPVPAGSKIRAGATVKDVTTRGPGRHVVTYEVTVEIAGEEKPALVADWLAMVITE